MGDEGAKKTSGMSLARGHTSILSSENMYLTDLIRKDEENRLHFQNHFHQLTRPRYLYPFCCIRVLYLSSSSSSLIETLFLESSLRETIRRAL
jgi:hypothetical protein